MDFRHSSSVSDGPHAEWTAETTQTPRRPLWRLLAALFALACLVIGLSIGAVLWTGRSIAEPAEAEPLPVALLTAERQPSYERLRLFPGRIAATRRSDLAFERAGLLLRVSVDDGDWVDEGQVLAALDIEPLERRRTELTARREAIEARRRLAEATFDRQRVLVDRGHSSAQTLDDIRFEEAALAAEVLSLEAGIAAIDLDITKSSLRAPFAGRIEQRMVDEGTVVEPGRAVVGLIETGRQEARVGVPEAVSRTLRIGEPYPLDLADRSVIGTLRALTPSLDPATRTVTAVFDIGGDSGTPGDLLRLRNIETVSEPGFWLPRQALTESLRGLWAVYITVPDEDSGDPQGLRVERADVEILHAEPDRVFARGTLSDGSMIIADGAHRVVPGQAVISATALIAEAPR